MLCELLSFNSSTGSWSTLGQCIKIGCEPFGREKASKKWEQVFGQAESTAQSKTNSLRNLRGPGRSYAFLIQASYQLLFSTIDDLSRYPRVDSNENIEFKASVITPNIVSVYTYEQGLAREHCDRRSLTILTPIKDQSLISRATVFTDIFWLINSRMVSR